MKVCMITGTLPPMKCGVGDYTNLLCKKLVEFSEKIELSVITTKGLNRDNKFNTYDIVNDWSRADLKKIVNCINNINPDIVHIQYPTLSYKRKLMINLLPYFLNKKYKIVTTIHEYSDLSLLGKMRIWPNIYFSDAVIVVDEQYISDIKKIKFLYRNKFYFINNASHIKKSNISDEKRNEIRTSILNEACTRILGYFGFINKTKGLESILYAMDKLNTDNKLKTILLIIGDLSKENIYHQSIITLIHELKLEKYVYVTGYLNEAEVGDYINSSDYIVLPFVYGVSTKNTSFLACLQEGKYIVTTKRNNKKVFDNDNVFYLRNYDDLELLSKIIQDNQYKDCKCLSVNMNNEFSWDNIVSSYLKIYTELFSK